MYSLDTPVKGDYPEMLDVWESSVRATHHFLKEEDIGILKEIILNKEVFDQVSLTCIRDSNKNIRGIMGVVAENLAMLFVHGDFISRGIGKQLLSHAISCLHVKKVDVNEQNEKALRFYEHFGFRIISRSDLDDNGMPFPILHMQLQ